MEWYNNNRYSVIARINDLRSSCSTTNKLRFQVFANDVLVFPIDKNSHILSSLVSNINWAKKYGIFFRKYKWKNSSGNDCTAEHVFTSKIDRKYDLKTMEDIHNFHFSINIVNNSTHICL